LALFFKEIVILVLLHITLFTFHEVVVYNVGRNKLDRLPKGNQKGFGAV